MSEPSLPEGFRLLRFEAVGSTNEEAKNRAKAGAPDGTVVWAREQRTGRGRRGSRWHSPPGNLYSSTVLRPDCDPHAAAQVSFVAALAVADLLAALLPETVEIRCKWPNDVLLSGRKVSGILLESSTTAAGRLDWLVLGVGVNLVQHPGLGGPHPSTSLREFGGPEVSVETALVTYLAALADWRARWQNDGFSVIRRAWLARAFGLGRPITVKLDRTALEGRFADLDATGALVLELPDGARRTVTAGEVFFPDAVQDTAHAARD